MPTLEVLAPGPLAPVQDGGRPGHAALGVGPSGACDRRSLRLANRLVANAEHAPAIEATFGGLRLRFDADVVVATTGARCPATIADGRGTRDLPHDAVTRVPAGATVRLGVPAAGVRTYLAVRGGLVVPAVLGSCSTDVLSGIGPPALARGDRLGVGPVPAALPAVDVAPVPDPSPGPLALRILPGPRDDWLGDAGLAALVATTWTVARQSNRTALRLDGEPLVRARDDELASEGLVRGAIQVPPSGRPVLFLADHPVTGGYPVPACVVDEDTDLAAQARPGQALRLVLAGRCPPATSG
jgi:biotin-dependent carboxylase-like uncharacterized protein